MPLVRIDAVDATPAQLQQISDAIQQAMVEAIGILPSDRFHVARSVDGDSALLVAGNFLDIERDRPVFVNVTMRAGRTPEVKQAFYARAAELCHEMAGVEPRNLLIVIQENASPDWSFGFGAAQFIES